MDGMTAQSWREGIKVHPAADMFPMMSETELDELAADRLFDGRNRAGFCHN
jgi:hypothetical protein